MHGLMGRDAWRVARSCKWTHQLADKLAATSLGRRVFPLSCVGFRRLPLFSARSPGCPLTWNEQEGRSGTVSSGSKMFHRFDNQQQQHAVTVPASVCVLLHENTHKQSYSMSIYCRHRSNNKATKFYGIIKLIRNEV